MDQKQKALKNYLKQFVSENKQMLFESVLEKRTNKLTVVLEDIFQPQNASSAVRTCDCFGVQDIYVIENQYQYEINPRVVLGASKWVSMHYYNNAENNTLNCLQNLKSQGYKILATSPEPGCLSIEEVNIKEKNAVLFGTELTGLSKQALAMADERIRIPMHGFTESFNISASVAIVLYALSEKLRLTTNNWQLTETEKEWVRLHWYKSAVKNSDILEKEYFKSNFFDNL